MVKSTKNLTNVATYIGRMDPTDKVSREYLNPLIERGIPAIDHIAAAIEEQTGEEWTTQDIYNAVSKGTPDGSGMVVEILERMEEAFSGSMEKQSQFNILFIREKPVPATKRERAFLWG